jgi:fatty-acyl-CoA synthase
MSSQTKASDRFDLSRWRVAGNGADMIRPDVMQSFVDAFADAGFKATAFLPSYGLAEATLAVSIMPPGEGIMVELVEETQLSGGRVATGGSPAALSARSSIAASRRATWKSRSARKTARRCPSARSARSGAAVRR